MPPGKKQRVCTPDGALVFCGTYAEFKNFLVKNQKAISRSGIPEYILRELATKYFSDDIELERQQKKRKLDAQRWKFIQEQISDRDLPSPILPTAISADLLISQAGLLLGKWNTRKRHNRVTDFSSWIFYLHHGKVFLPGMASGKIGEREIKAVKRRRAFCRNDNWDLIYEDPLTSPAEPLRASVLEVRGQSIWGSPDYVFRNTANGTILIVEVKVSDRFVPRNCWPNVQAQLWAYGHMDRFFADEVDIILVGEIWGRDNKLRNTFVWRLFERDFYERNESAFLAYRTWVNALTLESEVERRCR